MLPSEARPKVPGTTMLPIRLVLCVVLVPLVWTVSPPNYSNAKEPVILFTLVNLEPARPPRTFGTSAVPACNGYVELRCELILETVLNTLSDGNATLKWVLPNPAMLKENRAFEKIENQYGPNIANLAITEFKPEDAGEYSCQLFVDGTATRYKQTINIPALDGTPLMKCDLTCERNEDEACQILEYSSIHCVSYGFPEPRIGCNVVDCETEESCSPPIPPETLFDFGTKSSLYRTVDKKVLDEPAVRSSRYHCDAINGKGSASSTIFIPVSAGVLKTPGPRPPPPVTENQNKPVFLGKRAPLYYAVGEKVQLICWTNENVGPIEWAFYNASTPNVKEAITNGSHQGLEQTSGEASGGHVSRIVVHAATLDHGGLYECSATNLDDSSTKSVQLVMETYRWAEDADMNEDRQASMRTGSTVTMKCTIVTTKDDPGIRWYKDGLFLQTDERIQTSADKQTLTISSATSADSGVYTCSSRPRFGLGVDDLEGKTTLLVTDTGIHSEQVTSINNALTSLFSVQETLLSLSESFSKRQ